MISANFVSVQMSNNLSRPLAVIGDTSEENCAMDWLHFGERASPPPAKSSGLDPELLVAGAVVCNRTLLVLCLSVENICVCIVLSG